jgi:uncharacterized caspase-like protein
MMNGGDGLGLHAMLDRKFHAAIVLSVLLLLIAAGKAHSEKRVALIIGNATYQNTPALANPGNDAEDMASALKRVGFDVIFERNLNKRGMEQAIARFARAARDSDAALFYFAGHGMQYRGLNYLVPTDAKLEDEFSLDFEMTRLEDVLTGLGQSRGVRILVLDACRRNPLVEKLAGMSTTRDFVSTRGLARIDASRGMVVAYSTQADQLAIDGTGRNSPFTAALVSHITEPGLEIGTLFRRVATEVNKSTGGRQLPELSVSLLGEFYFSKADTDAQAWSKVRRSQNTAELQEFLTRYPKSPLGADIRERLQAIETAERTRIEREQVEQQRVENERERAERVRREQAENVRLERERIAREQVDRKRTDPEQAARDEQTRLEQERQRLAQQQAGQDRPPAAPAANVQTAMLTPPAEPTPSPPSPGGALIQEIKKELKRVGCYTGRIDEKWPTAEMTASLKNFARNVSLATRATELTIELLDSIREKSERVCPLECTGGQAKKNGQCVTKTCPPGRELGNNGQCVRPGTTKTAPERETQSPARPSTCSGSLALCTHRTASRGVTNANCVTAFQVCMKTGIWDTTALPHGRYAAGKARR